jgi:ABC-type lipoprotein release transport system permease subunit
LLMTAVEQPVTSGWIFLATFLLAVVIFIGVMVWIVAKAAAEGWEEIFRF